MTSYLFKRSKQRLGDFWTSWCYKLKFVPNVQSTSYSNVLRNHYMKKKAANSWHCCRPVRFGLSCCEWSTSIQWKLNAIDRCLLFSRKYPEFIIFHFQTAIEPYDDAVVDPENSRRSPSTALLLEEKTRVFQTLLHIMNVAVVANICHTAKHDSLKFTSRSFYCLSNFFDEASIVLKVCCIVHDLNGAGLVVYMSDTTSVGARLPRKAVRG